MPRFQPLAAHHRNTRQTVSSSLSVLASSWHRATGERGNPNRTQDTATKTNRPREKNIDRQQNNVPTDWTIVGIARVVEHNQPVLYQTYRHLRTYISLLVQLPLLVSLYPYTNPTMHSTKFEPTPNSHGRRGWVLKAEHHQHSALPSCTASSQKKP